MRVPRGNLLGAEGQGVDLTRNAFLPGGVSIGIFATAAKRQAFDIAYRFALTEKRGGPVPIIEHQAVSDMLADAKGKIEAVRLLAWRALDAVMSMHPSGPELAPHARIFGSETGRPGHQRPHQDHRRDRLRREAGYDPLSASGMA